eukprot:GEMP01026059.1.p1 GENE.GEMP01026059.1~~GEMP01026059.1.p1  ORF type:complete len:512 (+),score=106.92 GEMP01026059.1:777-2312(+)
MAAEHEKRKTETLFRLLETSSLRCLVGELLTRWMVRIPYFRRKLAKSITEATVQVAQTVKKHQIRRFEQLPIVGRSTQDVVDVITADYAKEKELTSTGKMAGTIYHGGEDLATMFGPIFNMFYKSNPLHADAFQTSRQIEAEAIRMIVSLYNGDDEACGVMTSGGTESILMAMKAYRDRGVARGITEPNICVPISAHAAFSKAGQYFNIAVNPVALNPLTSQVCLKAMRRAVNSRTVAIVGSCPSFPHGTIDPIEDLAKLALKWNTGLHVDCCLGSFIVPFMGEAGYPIAPFDFRVPGVTTISCDVHKYGFSPKGCSTLMYRNKQWRKYQYSFMPEWQGGIYATPGMAGSRCGALPVLAWAVMVKMGRDGYINSTRTIVEAQRKVADGIRKMKGVRIIGSPDTSVVAFACGEGRDEAKFTYGVNDAMTERGWCLSALQQPPAIHHCLTLPTAATTDEFLSDLSTCIDVVTNDTTGKYDKGTAAVYGTAIAVSKSIVSEFCAAYLDVCYETS